MSEYYGLFVGVGAMFVFFALAYMFFQISRTFKSSADSGDFYETAERSLVRNFFDSKGIDLAKEKIIEDKFKNKDFRQKVLDDAYNKYVDSVAESKKK